MLATKIRRLERTTGSLIIAYRCRRKIKRISRHLPVAEIPNLKASINARFPGYSCDFWHRAYAAASGLETADYVPEDLFYNVIESRLNPRYRRVTYRDKNIYDRLNWSCLPETVCRIAYGRLYDKAYQPIGVETALKLAEESQCAEFVVKPTRQTGGGSKIAFLDMAGLQDFLQTHLAPPADWIVQLPMQQHEEMAALNPSSINTVRIVTIRIGNQVSFVSAFARIGKKGLRVDNLTAGNVAIGVRPDGHIAKYGYDVDLRRCSTHPGHGYAFEGIVIPSFREARAMCIELHEGIPDLDLISWDVAIDRSGAPVVVEFNVRRQDINISQVCCGPVLSPYVDQVLNREKWVMVPGIGAIDTATELSPDDGG